MFIELVRLTNGTTVPKSLVPTLMVCLQTLYEKDRSLLLELREKCRNPTYTFPQETKVKQRLEDLWLILQDGSVYKDTRNVVLSACQGEMSEMKLVSPVAET